MRSKARALLRNPVVIIVPLVLLGLVCWNVYLSVVAEAPNTAHNNLLTGGDFEQLPPQGLPEGWSASGGDATDFTLRPSSGGFFSTSALTLNVTSGEQDVLELATPQVMVTPGLTYLYKNYYRTGMPLELVTAYYYRDGSRELRLAGSYDTQKDWSMTGVAFEVPRNVRKVQILHRFAGKGTASLDGAYLERRSDVFIAPYLPDVLPEVMLPAKVHGGSCLLYEARYQTRRPVALQAVFAMKDGTTRQVAAGQWGPAPESTRALSTFEAPVHALRIEKILAPGLRTDDLHKPTLYNCNRRGERTFPRPMVSVAIDGNNKAAAMVAPRLLQWQHMHATFYVSLHNKKAEGTMDGSDIAILQKTGHQLALYEPRDLSIVGKGQINRWLALGQGELRERWQLEHVDLAAPNDQTDPEARSYAERHFRSRRGQRQGINWLKSFDPYDVRTMYVTDETSPEQLRTILEHTRQGKGWVILAYQRIGDDMEGAVGLHEFEAHLKLIKGSKLQVVTVEQALSYTK